LTVKEFNRIKGIYKFNLDEFETEFHAHPAVEIVISKNENLTVETVENGKQSTRLVIVNSNIIHKISSNSKDNDLTMIECHPEIIHSILTQFKLEYRNGIYTCSDSNKVNKIVSVLNSTIAKSDYSITNEPRVVKCLLYLNSANSEYRKMIYTLKSKVNLSESRLSHIFKEETGISLKKYLIWSKLKRAFELVLTKDMSMYEASLNVGFYDQAHLSKAFKSMLGISPSEIYNSRTIQNINKL